MNIDIESVSPLVNFFVYYTLLEASPRAHLPLPRLVLMFGRLAPTSLPQMQ